MKKISFISNVVVPLLTLIVTTILFFVLGPTEKTTLFYVNLGYALFLEAIFFGYLSFARSGSAETTGAFYSVIGVYSTYYIIIGFIMMMVYTLGLSEIMALKYYISALAVFTLAWIIVGTLLAETDVYHKADTVQLGERGKTLHYYLEKMAQIERRYIALSKKLELPSTSENYACEFSRLTVKVKSLLPNVFNSETAQSTLSTMINSCDEVLNGIEDGQHIDKEAIINAVKRTIDRNIEDIELLKSLTRK